MISVAERFQQEERQTARRDTVRVIGSSQSQSQDQQVVEQSQGDADMADSCDLWPCALYRRALLSKLSVKLLPGLSSTTRISAPTFGARLRCHLVPGVSLPGALCLFLCCSHTPRRSVASISDGTPLQGSCITGTCDPSLMYLR